MEPIAAAAHNWVDIVVGKVVSNKAAAVVEVEVCWSDIAALETRWRKKRKNFEVVSRAVAVVEHLEAAMRVLGEKMSKQSLMLLKKVCRICPSLGKPKLAYHSQVEEQLTLLARVRWIRRLVARISTFGTLFVTRLWENQDVIVS